MTDIDTAGRILLTILGTGTLLVAAMNDFEVRGGGAAAVAMVMAWATPWLVGGALALVAAAGRVPW